LDIFVARQPIFNKNLAVIAYELLYRDSDKNYFNTNIASDVATAILLMNSYFHFGIDHLVGQLTAFINFDAHLIHLDIPQLLSTRNVVIEILEDVKPEPNILAKLERLRRDGYTIAIDDFVLAYPYHEIINLSQIIKVDFLSNSREDIQKICYKYRNQGKLLLAEKVETHEDFEWAKKLGFDYFQGYFFAKPHMIKSKDLTGSSSQFLRLFEALQESEPDYKKITRIIEIDVFLTYKLLRIVNSSFSLGTQIASVHQALSILGINAFSKWLSLASLQSLSKSHATELVKTAMIRSKFLEHIAFHAVSLEGHEDELALMGILSVIDVLLQEPMTEVVKNLPLTPNVKKTFLGQENLYLYPYQLCLAYEQGDFSRLEAYADMIEYNLCQLSLDYIDAVTWAEGLFHYMNDIDSAFITK